MKAKTKGLFICLLLDWVLYMIGFCHMGVTSSLEL